MRFYDRQHRFYAGIDLHSRTMHLCILDTTGTVVADVNLPGTVEIPEGKVVLKTEFTPDPDSKTGGGDLKLFVNDKPAGEGKLTRTFFRHGLEPFEVGRDSITPVDPAYKDKGVFAFTGKIEKVAFELTNK